MDTMENDKVKQQRRQLGTSGHRKFVSPLLNRSNQGQVLSRI
jgi:hypothetical protein